MGIKLANNAVSRLAWNITDSATTIVLVPGESALFPALSAGDWFPATIVSNAGALEIVKVTARSVDTLTVERGQEGTVASEFLAGDRLEMRLTAGAIAAVQAEVLAFLPAGMGPLPWSRP